ncbi:MAG: helix-hairpin-helix domain-containing protein [Clostridiales Family XIII bacterium]|jgi:competence protein ComEA|nr:helix-hairpin-helix domain-containing protein [Clostridiales Family XIII bacterium]
MEAVLRAFAKNYKLYAKILAVLVLLSCAIGLYLHRSAGGAEAGEILITGGVEVPGEGEAAAEASSATEENAGTEAPAAETEAPAALETIVVDVGGAVQSPTVLVLPAGSRVYEALEAAGGLLPQADIRAINRATVLRDGDRIYIPSKEESAEETPVPQSAGGGAGVGVTNAASRSLASAADEAARPVNINTADSAELQRLDGVGPSTAQKILDYRAAHGRFARAEDIKNVSGIGDKTFEKLKDKIAVD